MKTSIILILLSFELITFAQVRNFDGPPEVDYKKEISDVSILIKQFPDSVNYYVKRAELVFQVKTYYRQNSDFADLKYKDVLIDMDKAISIQPNAAYLYEKRGNYKWEMFQDTTGAMIDKSKAVEIEPNNPDWLDKRGTLYVQIGNYTKACEDYKKGASMGHVICKRSVEAFCR
jgi:tetratricopeptide (TPR) repeat protein